MYSATLTESRGPGRRAALGAMLAAGTLAGIVMGVLGVQLAGLVIMPIALILSAAFYVSLFFGFRDSFGEPE